MSDQFKTLKEFLGDFDSQYKSGAFGTPVVETDEAELKTVTIDISLVIRLMEFAREEAKDDVVLHKIAENLEKIQATKDEPLTMDDYDNIIPEKKEEEEELSESTSFRIGPENTILLQQVSEGQKLNASHYTLLTKLMQLSREGRPLNRNNVSEISVYKIDVDEIKRLDRDTLNRLARIWLGIVAPPGVMFDYFAGSFADYVARVVPGCGSE